MSSWCDICQVSLTSAAVANAHYSGKKHLATMSANRARGVVRRGSQGFPQRGAVPSNFFSHSNCYDNEATALRLCQPTRMLPLKSILKTSRPFSDGPQGWVSDTRPAMSSRKSTYEDDDDDDDERRHREKRPKLTPVGEPPPKNPVAVLHEYRPDLEYQLVEQSGQSHMPVFTMVLEINGKKFEASASNKKKAKCDLAEKVLAELQPQLEEEYKILNAEKLELEEAEREHMRAAEEKRNASVENTGEGAMICYDDKITNFIHRPKTSLKVLSELNLDAHFSEPHEEIYAGSTLVVIEVTMQNEMFEGQGRTKTLAKALAVEKALHKLYNVDFEYSQSGYPMYAGDPNQYKLLKQLYSNMSSTTSKPQRSEEMSDVPKTSVPKPPATVILVDGKNPVMLLNELYNGNVQYDSTEHVNDDGLKEFHVTASVEGFSVEGVASAIKTAKAKAAVAALHKLKNYGILAQKIHEKELKAGGKDRKPNSAWHTTDGGSIADRFPFNVEEKSVDELKEGAPTPVVNSVAKLNQLYPGLKYDTEMVGKDVNDPWFMCQVVVEKKTYRGSARNKKSARVDAAEKALRSLGWWTSEDEWAKKQAQDLVQRKQAEKWAEDGNQASWEGYDQFGSSDQGWNSGGGGYNNFTDPSYGVGFETPEIVSNMFGRGLSRGGGFGRIRQQAGMHRGRNPGNSRGINSFVRGGQLASITPLFRNFTGNNGSYGDGNYSDYPVGADESWGHAAPSILPRGRGFGARRSSGRRNFVGGGAGLRGGFARSMAALADGTPAASCTPGTQVITTYVETINPDGTVTRRRVVEKKQSLGNGAASLLKSYMLRGSAQNATLSDAGAQNFSADDFDYSQNVQGFQSFVDPGIASTNEYEYSVGMGAGNSFHSNVSSNHTGFSMMNSW